MFIEYKIEAKNRDIPNDLILNLQEYSLLTSEEKYQLMLETVNYKPLYQFIAKEYDNSIDFDDIEPIKEPSLSRRVEHLKSLVLHEVFKSKFRMSNFIKEAITFYVDDFNNYYVTDDNIKSDFLGDKSIINILLPDNIIGFLDFELKVDLSLKNIEENEGYEENTYIFDIFFRCDKLNYNKDLHFESTYSESLDDHKFGEAILNAIRMILQPIFRYDSSEETSLLFKYKDQIRELKGAELESNLPTTHILDLRN